MSQMLIDLVATRVWCARCQRWVAYGMPHDCKKPK